MNDEQVNAAIEDIERALVADDPDFARRVQVVRRNDAINFVAVFVLLAAGAVLLTVGRRTDGSRGRSASPCWSSPCSSTTAIDRRR